jgi:hypothetical protein
MGIESTGLTSWSVTEPVHHVVQDEHDGELFADARANTAIVALVTTVSAAASNGRDKKSLQLSHGFYCSQIQT